MGHATAAAQLQTKDPPMTMYASPSFRAQRKARADTKRSIELRAVREFIEALQDVCGSGALWFRTPVRDKLVDWVRADMKRCMGIAEQYAQMAAELGWPQLPDKTLSLHLQSWGCSVVEVNLRPFGGGRPRKIEWPETLAEIDATADDVTNEEDATSTADLFDDLPLKRAA